MRGDINVREGIGLAAELDRQATAYRLIKLLRAGGAVISLVDYKRGRPESLLVRDVQINCIGSMLRPTHRRTIKLVLRTSTSIGAPSGAAEMRS
jgi:putative transposase